MILKEIQALPAREKSKLLQRLDREREQAEQQDDVRLFDEAQKEVAGKKAEKISEQALFRMIQSVGKRMRTSLSADEMNAARREGQK